jgi:hypothetical protein
MVLLVLLLGEIAGSAIGFFGAHCEAVHEFAEPRARLL